MRILPIFIPHAGCEHTCVYCDQKSTSSRNEKPEPESVARIVAEALRYGLLDEVAYYGGSFTALPSAQQLAFLAVLQPFLTSKAIGGIRVSTRPDAINDEIVSQLQLSGVTTVELGCQSFADPVLKASGRGHSVADAVSSATFLRQKGFRLGIQLMPGLPAATTGEALVSLDAALQLNPDFLRVYPTVVLRGTQLASLWRQGLFSPLALDAAVEICADIELVCHKHAVPVIRYGLQSNENLDNGAVLAGPYHPAFGQLVKSRLWLRALSRLQNNFIDTIEVHPAEISDALGHSRNNLHYLKRENRQFTIRSGPHVQKGFVGVGGKTSCMNSLAAGKGY